MCWCITVLRVLLPAGVLLRKNTWQSAASVTEQEVLLVPIPCECEGNSYRLWKTFWPVAHNTSSGPLNGCEQKDAVLPKHPQDLLLSYRSLTSRPVFYTATDRRYCSPSPLRNVTTAGAAHDLILFRTCLLYLRRRRQLRPVRLRIPGWRAIVFYRERTEYRQLAIRRRSVVVSAGWTEQYTPT